MDPTVENSSSDEHAVAAVTATTPTVLSSVTPSPTNKTKRNYRTKKRDTSSDNEHDADEVMKDDIQTESAQQPQQPAASSSNLPYVQSQNAQNIGEVYPGLARLSFLDQGSGVEGGETEQEGRLGATRLRRPLQQKSLPSQHQPSSTSAEEGGEQIIASQSVMETLAAPPSTSPSATSSGIGSESSLIEIKDTALERKGRGLFSAAKDALTAGTLVFKEMGYCQVVNDASLSSVCSACFKDTREEQGEDEKSASAGGVSASNQRKLVRCAGCKVVWYCNKVDKNSRILLSSWFVIQTIELTTYVYITSPTATDVPNQGLEAPSSTGVSRNPAVNEERGDEGCLDEALDGHHHRPRSVPIGSSS